MTRKKIQKQQCQRQVTSGNLAEGLQLLKTAFDFFYDMNPSTTGLTKNFIWVFLYSVMKTWINFLGNAIYYELQYGTHSTHSIGGLPRCLSGKESAWQCRRCKRRRFDPSVGKIPCSRKWQLTSVFFPGEFHGWRSLAGDSLGVANNDMTQWIRMHALYVYVTLQ